jgi:uncharacterized circularly permuted ATP-grasp superfamily protein/uncharacterized alpha-E superfamily protein
MINTYIDHHQKTGVGFYDEMVANNGQVRPHWQKIAASIGAMGIGKLNQKANEVARQLSENGVTYHIYGDPEGVHRPWQLDPIPMVFGAEEWASIERGVAQRARLLDLLLKDLYGSRQVIRSGVLPFELVYNHAGFLRQADKLITTGPFLVSYSIDLAKGPDGSLWVLHDRTDTPSGMGYALENRAAMTRVFPDMVRDNRVQKISPYFQAFKKTLSDIALSNQENPRIILLTPGPVHKTYFEHAFLSSFLGFTLALGADLTMRNGNIWLRTLDGLKKADVILRRVEDTMCDPLEFNPMSASGIVGLMEAARQRNVVLANPLGTRILENPGLMPFLPAVCRYFLGEELLLPSVPTWWCGQPRELAYVCDHVDKLVIKHIYRSGQHKPIEGGKLSPEARAGLVQAIRREPHLYVAQEMVNFSSTPSLINNKLESRNAVIRTFAVAETCQPGSYQVMAGGLARSAAQKGTFIISHQTGGISKDIWILGPRQQDSAVVQSPVKLQQQEILLPSRTGEHLFWMGRYLERAINTIRAYRIILRKYNETDLRPNATKDPTLATLLRTLTELTGTRPGFYENAKLANPQPELVALALDQDTVGSLSHALHAFLGNGYAVRDRLGLDTWRILDQISTLERKVRKRQDLSEIHHYLDNMLVYLMAFNGLNLDNMTREPSWRLLNIGRSVEASIRTALMFQYVFGPKHDEETEKVLMELMLIANESLITYRYRYRSTLELTGVLRLLLTDEGNPKSLAYQIASVEKHLEQMPDVARGKDFSPARKKLLQSLTNVRLADPDRLAQTDKGGKKRGQLAELCQSSVHLLEESASLVQESYFSHTQSQYGFVKSARLPEI